MLPLPIELVPRSAVDRVHDLVVLICRIHFARFPFTSVVTVSVIVMLSLVGQIRAIDWVITMCSKMGLRKLVVLARVARMILAGI